MKTSLALFLAAITQVCACCYGCDDGETGELESGLRVLSPRLDGYAGASIGDFFAEDELLFVEMRAARGDGMTVAAINIESGLRAGHTYDSDDADGELAALRLVQDWRPHIGEWNQERVAERVVLEVEAGPRPGLVRVSFAAYFDGNEPSRGSFVVPLKRAAK